MAQWSTCWSFKSIINNCFIDPTVLRQLLYLGEQTHSWEFFGLKSEIIGIGFSFNICWNINFSAHMLQDTLIPQIACSESKILWQFIFFKVDWSKVWIWMQAFLSSFFLSEHSNFYAWYVQIKVQLGCRTKCKVFLEALFKFGAVVKWLYAIHHRNLSWL